MKTAKQEAIEKAYGEHWEKLKKYVDSDGCIPYEYLEDDEYLFNFYDNIDTEYNGDSWRPISLKGLENNNGWTVIQGKEDLPKEDIECRFIYYGSVYLGNYIHSSKTFFSNGDCFDECSHYKPIVNDDLPIY